jgi:hypothetical protein
MFRVCAIVFILVAVFVTGCVRPVIMAPTNEERVYTATDPKNVSISTMRLRDKPSTELGYVFAQGQSIEEAEKLAREEAAKMGGTMIVGARENAQVILSGFILFFPIYETYYFVRGTVVKFE